MEFLQNCTFSRLAGMVQELRRIVTLVNGQSFCLTGSKKWNFINIAEENILIKACIFDLDGTLCDTLTTIAYFANEALKHFGLEPIEVNEYKYMIGNGYKNLITKCWNF